MRVSATTLESFRLWQDGDWMPEGDLIATIKGEFVQTPAMLLGQAFGRCLETGEKYRDGDGYSVPVRFNNAWKMYYFTSALMEPCFAEFDRRGVFEVKAQRQYGDVLVVAKMDQAFGTRIIENKAKTSQFDFDRYAESYQWRFELDLLEGSTALTYKVFLLDETKEGETILRGIESFNLYPYPALHDDCSALVERFTQYARLRGLDAHLIEQQRKWA